MEGVNTRKKARIEKEVAQIPEELRYEILKTLPVKSLLRFRVVCRTWYALISGPEFCTKLHQKRSCLLIFRRRLRTLTTISMKGQQNPVRPTPLPLPWELEPRSRFLGSCNGLVCFYQRSFFFPSLIVWNPSTRKFMEVSFWTTKQVPFSVSSHGRSFGFGYDASSDDYKLVWMWCEGLLLGFDAFSLKSKTWSSFSHHKPSNITGLSGRRQCAGVFSNGAIHWILSHKDRASDNGIGIFILALDLASEKYKLLETPKECDLSSKVVSLSGCLCLYTHGDSSVDLWMMKEYGVKSSWIKLMSLPTTLRLGRSSMSLWKDHPIHFLNEEGSIVATYCSSRRDAKIMRLQVEKGKIVSCETLSSVSIHDVILEESLVSLN